MRDALATPRMLELTYPGSIVADVSFFVLVMTPSRDEWAVSLMDACIREGCAKGLTCPCLLS